MKRESRTDDDGKKSNFTFSSLRDIASVLFVLTSKKQTPENVGAEDVCLVKRVEVTNVIFDGDGSRNER